MLFRLALTSGGSSSPHETMVGAIRRHELTGVLEVTIPVGFARIARTDLDSLLTSDLHNGVDGGLSGLPFPMRNMTAFWLERTMLVMSLNISFLGRCWMMGSPP